MFARRSHFATDPLPFLIMRAVLGIAVALSLVFAVACSGGNDDLPALRDRRWVEPVRPGLRPTQWVLEDAGPNWIDISYDAGDCGGRVVEEFVLADERYFRDAVVVTVFIRSVVPNCFGVGREVRRRISLRHVVDGRAVFDGGQTPPRVPEPA